MGKQQKETLSAVEIERTKKRAHLLFNNIPFLMYGVNTVIIHCLLCRSLMHRGWRARISFYSKRLEHKL